jgi:ATP synthase protein I
MTASLAKKGRDLASKVLIFQSAIGLVFTLIFMFFLGKSAAISALCGALICVIPGLVFARFAFKYAGASQNKLVVRSFNQGSKLKMALSIILFFLVYKWVEVVPSAMLVTYVITLLCQWPYIIFLSRVEINETQ